MAKSSDRAGHASTVWSVIGHHDWESQMGLETTLRDAIDSLDGETEDKTLYEYIDVEALTEVVTPGASRGATAVCFKCGQYEIKICDDGTITAR